MQRVTALALIPLSLWFALSLASLASADYIAAAAWLQSPFNAALMAGLLLALFYHAYLGLRVVLEDYVHHHGLLIASVLTVKFALALLALMALLAVVRVYLGG